MSWYGRCAQHFILLAILLSGAGVCPVDVVNSEAGMPTEQPVSVGYNYWQKKAILDFRAVEKKLKKHHPGFFDQASDLFRTWLVKGKKDFNERLKLINNKEGWRFALKAYVAGFNDIHVRALTAFRDKDEWPGFLLQFDGVDFVVTESACKAAPNGCIVTEIDGVSVKKWLDKNILPFVTNVPETSGRYVDAAACALVWERNPFITKPKTVRILKKEPSCFVGAQIPLSWSGLSSVAYTKKMNRIFNRTLFNDLLNPLQLKDLPLSIAWIKIATFMPRGQWARFMFARDVRKLTTKASKKALVFDLRGNGGGLFSNALKSLVYLYGVDAVKAAEKACSVGVGFNLTSRVGNKLNPKNEADHGFKPVVSRLNSDRIDF